MPTRRNLMALGIGVLLWAMCGLAWAQPADESTVIAQQLQAMLQPPIEPAAPSDAAIAQVQAFYTARDFRPAWNRPETVPAFVAALYTLVNDGLNPSDYGADRLTAAYRRAYAPNASTLTRARFDVTATRVYLSVLDNLNRGKVSPTLLQPDWGLPVEHYQPDMRPLSRAVDTLDFESAFAMARPPYATYQRLRAALARYRDIQSHGGWPLLPTAAAPLRPGDRAPAVSILRQRLAAIGEPVASPGEPDLYDDALADAVRRFQRNHYLHPDAVVGAQTRSALNVSVGARIDQIRINLERARLLLHALPTSFVLVDIAGYQLTYYRPDGQIWRTRIVVGKPYRRTPSLRSEITHLTFNPTWTVPYSITYREMLPRIRRDPDYLAREHLRVFSPSGRQLNPATIDWQHPPPLMLRQDAGPQDALGRVVFRFDNPYRVYLHDTPAQSLFGQPRRAFSHGCMRVENALEFARLLLDDEQRWNAADIDRTVHSGRKTRVDLPRPVPVIVNYWTVNVAEDGQLAFKPDIYARDQALLLALNQPLDLIRGMP